MEAKAIEDHNQEKIDKIKGKQHAKGSHGTTSPSTHVPIASEALISKTKALEILQDYEKGQITPNWEVAEKQMQKVISAYQALGCTLETSASTITSLMTASGEVKKQKCNSVRESEAWKKLMDKHNSRSSHRSCRNKASKRSRTFDHFRCSAWHGEKSHNFIEGRNEKGQFIA